MDDQTKQQVLESLKAMQASSDRIERKLEEFIQRLTQMETTIVVASQIEGLAPHQTRIRAVQHDFE